MVSYNDQALIVLSETEIDAVLISLMVLTIVISISLFGFIKKTL